MKTFSHTPAPMPRVPHSPRLFTFLVIALVLVVALLLISLQYWNASRIVEPAVQAPVTAGQAWQEYRTGERTATLPTTTFTLNVDRSIWDTYRAGERTAALPSAATIWMQYLTGERTYVRPSPATVWMEYLTGVRTVARPDADRAAWEAYRVDERTAALPTSIFAFNVDRAAWEEYRAAERAPTPLSAATIWMQYLTGERTYVRPNPATIWLQYLTGAHTR